MTPTEGQTEWESGGFEYAAEIRGGELVKLHCTPKTMLPRDHFNLLQWLQSVDDEDWQIYFCERAKRENELDWQRERDNDAEDKAAMTI